MKISAFLFAIIITTNLFGQSAPKGISNADFRKVQIGVNFSPDYCFRTLKNNGWDSTSKEILNLRNNSETPKLGYTCGLSFVYNFSEKFGLETGVQFSNKGYQTKKQDLNFGSMIDPRRGLVYNTSGGMPARGRFIYNDYYIDIPLKGNFIYGHKKIRYIASTGVILNVFVKGTSTCVLYNENGSPTKHTSTSPYGYNRINLSPFISTGIDWKLNDKNNLRIEPIVKYGALKIIDAPVTGYLWNFGLNISYYFGL